MGLRDLAAARTYLEEAVKLTESVGNSRDLGAALTAQAQLHRIEGNLDAAEPLYRRAMGLARELGDRESVAVGLLNLAMVAISRRHHVDAAAMLVEAGSIVDETGSRLGAQSLLAVCAALASHRSDWQLAARWFGAAEAQAALSGSHPDPADDAFLQPFLSSARDALGDKAFTAGATAARSLSAEQVWAEASAWLARAPVSRERPSSLVPD